VPSADETGTLAESILLGNRATGGGGEFGKGEDAPPLVLAGATSSARMRARSTRPVART
jgi:hypothetical protein